MQIHKVEDQTYDGSALHHAFCYENAGPLGPSITYFRGPAEVKAHLVDIEDRLADDFIKSKDMWHFIIEIPNATLTETVLWQRKFISICVDWLRDPGNMDEIRIAQEGDDIIIYHDSNTLINSTRRKMSVSIATLSRFSGMIHAGINIEVGEGCPVPAVGLKDLVGGKFLRFAADVSHAFAVEYQDILNATYKVSEVS